MSLFRAYKYLFYRSYKWQLDMFGKNDVPEFTAMLANSLVLFLNLAILVVSFKLLTGFQMRLEKSYAVVGMVFLLAVNYFILVHNGKARRIISEFAAETEAQRRFRTLVCWAYVTISYLVFLVLVMMPSPTATS